MNINSFLSICERRGYFNWMPTKFFLKYKYKRCAHKKLDLDSGKAFSEKLQALKIMYASSPELDRYTHLADKVEAKKIIADIIGEEYIIPTIGVWDNFDDIDFTSLPNKFVLKTNHDSGGVVICDGKEFDRLKAKKKLQKSLRRNFYWYGREPQYKNIRPKLLAERYIASADEMVEYKLFCFDGEVKCILVCQGEAHGSGRTNTFYDLNFNRLPITAKYPQNTDTLERPAQLDELIELSHKITIGIPQARADWYVVNGKIYFGEVTFFHDSGFTPLRPIEWDKTFGDWIKLPNE